MTWDTYKGYYTGCNPEALGKAAEEKIAELETKLKRMSGDGSMIQYVGWVNTQVNLPGADCHFEFEVPEGSTEAEISHRAKSQALKYVRWHYQPRGTEK